ncbi:hypothetical protein [Novosphingobium lentum]|uniref:hypothetical protein n=1 Tax=Novosphingobium lentum TaxID=145287 RepID=UPI00082E0B0B|nr:hypothetical protein [Novosphingobium lentum]
MSHHPASASKPAGHPFRRSLPPRVLRPLPTFEPEVIAAEQRAALAALRSPDVSPWKFTRQDLKDFLLAYCACFIAVSVWIA